MVSPLNPLKKEESHLILPTDIRLNLARMAVEKSDRLHVSDFETRLPVPSYTITTLTELHKAYPDCEFSLLVGQDNWERFDRWHQSDVIRASHDIIVYGRPASKDLTNHKVQSSNLKVQSSPLPVETRACSVSPSPTSSAWNTVQTSNLKSQSPEVTINKKDGTSVRLSDSFSFSLFDISSTQIREAFKTHNLPFAAKWLNPAVFRFVLENGLYSA